MEIKETKSEDLLREFTATVSKEDVGAAIDQEAAKYAPKVKLDGFRKGKVPPTVVKKLYGNELNSEVVNHLVEQAVAKIVTDYKLKLASKPVIDVTKFDPKEGLEVAFKMELYPEMPAIDLEKITLTDYQFKIDKEEFDESLNKLLSMHKELEDAKAGTKAKEGDTALIDFTGYIDGKEFPGGSAKDYKLPLGEGHFIPGFEDGLIGSKEGDSKTLKLTFPKDYGSKAHAGKKVEFKVDVKKVYHAKLPKFDDAFAKKLHLDNKKAVEDAIHKHMDDYYNKIKNDLIKKELFDKLEKSVTFKLPPMTVQGEFEHLMKHAESSEEKAEDKKKQEKLYKQLAERRVKLGMLVSELAKQEDVKVETDDIKQEITNHMRSMPDKAQEIMEYYKNNQQAVEKLKGQIYENKIVDILLAKLKKVEKKTTTKNLLELFKELEKEYKVA